MLDADHYAIALANGGFKIMRADNNVPIITDRPFGDSIDLELIESKVKKRQR